MSEVSRGLTRRQVIRAGAGTTTSSACVANLSHSWLALHSARDGGKMDNWVPAMIAANGPTDGPLTMGYYTRNDIPYHYALADAFTICDGYHCSVMGPTNPNRLYSMTGMIDPTGQHGGPVVDNAETPPYTWTTYPERLEAAGIDWRVYQQVNNYDDNPLAWFKQFQQAPHSSPLYQRGLAVENSLVDRFAEDVATGNLPQVSWIIGPDYQSEHPSYLPAEGAQLISQIVSVLADNPKVFSKTAPCSATTRTTASSTTSRRPPLPPGLPANTSTRFRPRPTASAGRSGSGSASP